MAERVRSGDKGKGEVETSDGGTPPSTSPPVAKSQPVERQQSRSPKKEPTQDGGSKGAETCYDCGEGEGFGHEHIATKKAGPSHNRGEIGHTSNGHGSHLTRKGYNMVDDVVAEQLFEIFRGRISALPRQSRWCWRQWRWMWRPSGDAPNRYNCGVCQLRTRCCIKKVSPKVPMLWRYNSCLSSLRWQTLQFLFPTVLIAQTYTPMCFPVTLASTRSTRITSSSSAKW